jgi:hypothetical protein
MVGDGMGSACVLPGSSGLPNEVEGVLKDVEGVLKDVEGY